jgi:hypothetical protein
MVPLNVLLLFTCLIQDTLVQDTLYALYRALCIMFLMRADTLGGQVGVSLALEIESFLTLVKWHRADRRVPFGPKNSRFPGPNPLPLSQVMDLPALKIITHRDV